MKYQISALSFNNFMKLKELKKLIEGCHPEDLNNDVEAVVISKKNKVFKSDSIRLDTDSGRIIIATQDSEQYKLNKINADKEMGFAQKMLSIKSKKKTIADILNQKK